MSYPLDLDEMSEKKLRDELERREVLQRNGRCDYCTRKVGTVPACKFPDRHAGKKEGNHD